MVHRWIRRACPGFWVAAALAVLPSGCGGSGGGEAKYASARLEGEVTLDGKPIDSGSVEFVPQDQQAPPVRASILKGRYVAPKVGLGKVIAIISVEPPPPPAVVDSTYTPPKTVNVPDRYRNGLPIDVSGNKSDQDFAMSSK